MRIYVYKLGIMMGTKKRLISLIYFSQPFMKENELISDQIFCNEDLG